MSLREINYPEDLEYSSDGKKIPLEFYLDVLPNSNQIYLKLGYFSSKAIQVLAYGFAQFIHNGGHIKIITNHFLYKQDKELLSISNEEITESNDIIESKYLSDIEWVNEKLSNENSHLLDCLKLLVKMNRLEVIPVMLKPGRMAHYKQGIFSDKLGNKVLMDGSCNFTANGLLQNAETISVYRSWGSEAENCKIRSKQINIDSIVSKNSDLYDYLGPEHILDAIVSIGRDKDLDELLNDELTLFNSVDNTNLVSVLEKYRKKLVEKIEIYKETPRFPFAEGPREYQKEALDNWIASNKQGIFAMATGTGKTITAINCLLHECLEVGYYQAIILVPSQALLEQWYSEVRNFNFKSIFRVSSNYNWKADIDLLITGLEFNTKYSFIMISTYQSFTSDSLQSKIFKLPPTTLFIADEAHNIGSIQMKAILPKLKYSKRIALSATPRRRFDDEGNEVIENFFNSKEPYTYSFSMERAIREQILCPYDYYPHKIYLNEQEMEAYAEISRKLQRMFDSKTKSFRNADAAKMLLLERRRIIHKASNKLQVFKDVVQQVVQDKGSLNYSFIYVPEGDDENDNLLNQYMLALKEKFPSVRAHHYTSASENREEVMRNFEEGYINSLFSMKCLDEGIDIPRAEIAIFCASTGNPRQFIQRRGRILRKHKDKTSAVIHDLVVLPTASREHASFQIEQKLIQDELTRVVYFASLSRNYYAAMEEFRDVADTYDLNLYSLEESLKENTDG